MIEVDSFSLAQT